MLVLQVSNWCFDWSCNMFSCHPFWLQALRREPTFGGLSPSAVGGSRATCSGSQQTWHRKLPGAVGFADFACWAKRGKSSPLDCAMDCAMDCTIQSAGPAKSRSSTLCGYELNPSGQERFWRPPRKLKHFWRVNKGIQRLCTQRYTKVLKNVRELQSDCALCAPHCANFNTQFRFDVGLGLLPPEANRVTLNDLTHLCSSLDQFGLSNLMLVGAIWYSLSLYTIKEY